MIIEFIFDQLHPRKVPAFETAFQETLPARSRLSPLGGFWRTEVGAIDQVVHLWCYEDAGHRARVQAEAARTLQPVAPELIQETSTLLLEPAPFSPTPQAEKLGNIYELRIYDYETQYIPSVTDAWREKIPARTRLSPIVLCGHAPAGAISRWVHLWVYDNAVDRQRIRAESLSTGVWPPAALTGLIRQRNMLLVPSRFSPLC